MNEDKTLYKFDDKVPFIKAIMYALQYLVPNMISILFVIIVLQQAHSDPKTDASVVSISMIVFAIISFWQAFKKFGSGTLLPPSIAPPYLVQSILAVKTGGLSLLYGMTILTGIFQILLSFVLRYAKKIFPPEIALLVLFLIGIELAIIAINTYLNIYHAADHLKAHQTTGLYFALNLFPIVLIWIFEHYGNNTMQSYSIFFGVLISYLLIFFLGYQNSQNTAVIAHASWIFFPQFQLGHYAFSWHLVIPFLIGAIVCSVKMVGSITALQEMQVNDPLKEADMKQISRANFIDGCGSLLAGLFAGSMGMNASSSGITLSLAKKVSSRYIAFPLAVILFALAFSPKISLTLALIPKSIMAAVLLELGASLVISSLKNIVAKVRELKNLLCFGIAISVGLSQSIYPSLYSELPPTFRMFTGSSIVYAAVIAIILNSIFLIRFKRKQPACNP